jgi:hypothetical protein
MPPIAPRISETELSQRILDMAKTGVYRESIFEALQPLATKRQIRNAISYAKQFGLYSVRELRDGELGTYYQVDPDKYHSFQAVIKASVPLQPGDDLAAQILINTQVIRAMLAIAGTTAIGLLLIGGACLITGHLASGRLAWGMSAGVGGVWLLQQTWMKYKLPNP